MFSHTGLPLLFYPAPESPCAAEISVDGRHFRRLSRWAGRGHVGDGAAELFTQTSLLPGPGLRGSRAESQSWWRSHGGSAKSVRHAGINDERAKITKPEADSAPSPEPSEPGWPGSAA
jgi:hypothetical protein